MHGRCASRCLGEQSPSPTSTFHPPRLQIMAKPPRRGANRGPQRNRLRLPRLKRKPSHHQAPPRTPNVAKQRRVRRNPRRARDKVSARPRADSSRTAGAMAGERTVRLLRYPHSERASDLVRCTELAPPTPGTPKSRPRKEIVPASSTPSSSTRALPPHRIPYVRRTEGYLSDEAAEQCTNVLRGASRDPILASLHLDHIPLP